MAALFTVVEAAAAATATITTTIIESAAATATASSSAHAAAASAAAAACKSHALYMRGLDDIPDILLGMAFPFVCGGLTEGLAYLAHDPKKNKRGSTPRPLPRGLIVLGPRVSEMSEHERRELARREAKEDAEAAREDALHFLGGTALLCALAFALTTWAAILHSLTYCFYPRGLPAWCMAIAWTVFTALTVYTLRGLGAWFILARDLGGKSARAKWPGDDANWVLGGIFIVLLWLPVNGAVEAMAWCQLHLCGRGKLPDEEVEMAPAQQPRRRERPDDAADADSSFDGASTLYEMDEEADEDRRLLGDAEKAVA